MDNQYGQPGGYPPQYPAGQQNPPYGEAPAPYAPQQQGYAQQGYTAPADPYTQQQGYAQQGYTAPADPYASQQQGYAQQGYTAPADPYAQQQGYAQQGYRNAAESYGTTAQYASMNTGYGAPQSYQAPYADPGANQAPYADPGAYQAPYSQEGYQHLFNQGAQEQPPVGFPPQMRKPARQSLSLSTRAMMAVGAAALVLIVGLVIGMVVLNTSPKTAQVGEIMVGALSATHTGDCLIVRNESPFDAESVTSIDYEAEEGSRVGRGAEVCSVYSTGYSVSAVQLLEQYRGEIRDQQKKLIESTTLYDGKLIRFETEILSLVTQVRELIGGAEGSLSNLEKQLADKVKERQDYLDQKYASDQSFNRTKDDARAQSQRIDGWTKLYTASEEGLVSFYSDGYEYSVNANTYMNFEPSEVRAMINGKQPEKTTVQKSRTTIYRLVRDNEWYVMFLSDDTEWKPVNGEMYELKLDQYENTKVTAQVVSFTRSGGELLVRLKINAPVEQVLYMRTCEAVLGESVSTLMVNERAINKQEGTVGVTIVDDTTESFIPVDVIFSKDGYVYFQAVQQGVLREGMRVRLY